MTPEPIGYSADAVDPSRPVVEGYEGADYYALMTEALHKILLEKQILTPADTDRVIAALEAPNVTWGARIVAQAWKDPSYKARLLADGSAAALEMGYTIKEAKLVVVENTASPQRHRLHPVLLLSAIAPRTATLVVHLQELQGADGPRTTGSPRRVRRGDPPPMEVRVHDSNADMRYLVLPKAPADAAVRGFDELVQRVTRNMLIGTELAEPYAG